MDLLLKETRPYIKVFNSLRSASFCLGRSGKGARGNRSVHRRTSWRSVQETAQKKKKTKRTRAGVWLRTARFSPAEHHAGRRRWEGKGFKLWAFSIASLSSGADSTGRAHDASGARQGGGGRQEPAAQTRPSVGEEGSEDLGGSGTGLTCPGQKLGFFI